MAAGVLLPGGVLSMTSSAAERLVRSGSGDAALLYLQLLRQGGQFDAEGVRKALGWSADRVGAAYGQLSHLGLARKDADLSPAPAPPEPDSPPDYTAADIAREMEGPGAFPHLVRELERRLGKVLSTADLKMLYTMFDYLALPAEVILLLATWCIEETERKYGPGRKPRMSQLRKEAFLWRRLGVDTPEAADAHVRALSALRSREARLLPLLGISGRAPVEGERRYINAWVEMGFDDEAIALAYEKTILKKGSLHWQYMNSILRSWHQKGLHTRQQVETGDSAWPKDRPAGAPAAQGPGAQPAGKAVERLKEDMDWMDRFLEQTGGKE